MPTPSTIASASFKVAPKAVILDGDGDIEIEMPSQPAQKPQQHYMRTSAFYKSPERDQSDMLVLSSSSSSTSSSSSSSRNSAAIQTNNQVTAAKAKKAASSSNRNSSTPSYLITSRDNFNHLQLLQQQLPKQAYNTAYNTTIVNIQQQQDYQNRLAAAAAAAAEVKHTNQSRIRPKNTHFSYMKL